VYKLLFGYTLRERFRRGTVAPVDAYLLGFDPEGDRVLVIGFDFQFDLSGLEAIAIIIVIAILLFTGTKCDSQQDHARDSKHVRSFHFVFVLVVIT
jgi:hypothetical protein